jgi:hypothetical protein
MKKGEKHHLKGRIIHMEAILDLCASKEVVHKNHARGAWRAHVWALWGMNHKSGRREKVLLVEMK